MNLEEQPPEVETPPVETPQVEAETPTVFPWDIPSVEAPEALSEADIRRITREEHERARNEEREPDYEEALINKALTVFEQRAAIRDAPRTKRDLVEDLTVGLGAEAKQYLNEYLEGYDGNVIAGIRSDPKTMKTLRLAAEAINGSKPTPKAAPRSEGANTITNDVADGAFDSSLEAMWKGGFNNVPGLTKEKFREEMKKRVS